MGYTKPTRDGLSRDQMGQVERERLDRSHDSDRREGVPARRSERDARLERLERLLRGESG